MAEGAALYVAGHVRRHVRGHVVGGGHADGWWLWRRLLEVWLGRLERAAVRQRGLHHPCPVSACHEKEGGRENIGGGGGGGGGRGIEGLL